MNSHCCFCLACVQQRIAQLDAQRLAFALLAYSTLLPTWKRPGAGIWA